MQIISSPYHLGALIHFTRKTQGLTQADLAASAGVGIRFIQDLERGKESCQLGKTLTVLSMLGLVVEIDSRSV